MVDEKTPGTCAYRGRELARTGMARHPRSDEDDGEGLPLLNSPRSGMCGYDGPADPPR
ncbi:MAG TPA: hypothetical protein VE913_24335 [Longimicrobium sp.]|nr:hypothetical protein [Longimicrobium sp.]